MLAVRPRTAGSVVTATQVQVDGRDVRLTSPDKVLVAGGVTKRDLVEHWLLVGRAALAHGRGALVSARRAPDGPDGEAFFQKNAPRGMPEWVRTAEVARNDGSRVRHVVLEDVAHLVALVQFGTVEVHVSLTGVDQPDRPRELVIDLDPPDGADHALVRRATRRTLAVCDELGLPTRLKASGSSGFHVHVPVTAADLATVHDVAHGIASLLVHRHPDELTTELHKEDRGGRVLVDWFRNTGGATVVAPWSPRIIPGAPCAVPLDRAELSGADPRGWPVPAVRRRLAQRDDPWADDGVVATDLVEQRRTLADALRELDPTAPDA
jgi:bifunctional non-homologous end joining protein LigD